MKSKIPQQRALVYLLLVGLLVPLLSLLYILREQRRLCDEEVAMHTLYHGAGVSQAKEARGVAIRHAFRDADRFYLYHYLEPLALLQEERAALQQLLTQDPSLPLREVLARLELLQGRSNQISFSEGAIECYDDIRETSASFTHPVQLSSHDLLTLLALIEGHPLEGDQLPKGRPCLLITDFKLTRKEIDRDNEVFLLDLKLLQREFQ